MSKEINDVSGSERPGSPSKQEDVSNMQDEQDGHEHSENVFVVKVKLPHEPGEMMVQVSTQEQVQDIRQSIMDQPWAMQYSCFHLEHEGERLNEFVELSEIGTLDQNSVLTLIEDPYTEKDARMHVIRIRELVGAAGDRTDLIHGIEAGASLHDSIMSPLSAANGHTSNGHSTHSVTDLGDLAGYEFEVQGSIKTLVGPNQSSAPKTIKSISLSPWNPPPYSLRTKGHLLYLVVVTNEGEQFHMTSHVSGFYLNRSSHNKFDPSPKGGPKTSSAHSLMTLIKKISPSFGTAFKDLLNYNSQRDPLALFQLTNAIPASSWTVSPQAVSLTEHQPDITRTQETYLISGTENTENLRDWNEEFQSTRELPKENVPDKVFRERLTSKLFADYNEAATRGAVLVARGEIAPLNPTESPSAQIFVYNNVFFSFGVDGVGTFATEGGDEAARFATGKDVSGVRAVNQLDVPGLFTASTVIVDYLGKRIVGQSIVPGIFRQRDAGEQQIDYGGVEGKDVIAENDDFASVFAKMSEPLYVRKHPVWDKEGKRHHLEASVDTKGLLGTDGRKYVLDLYRITPLDVNWIEQYWGETQEEKEDDRKKDYPHRMAVLRPELIETYRAMKLKEHVDKEIEVKMKERKEFGVEEVRVNGDKVDEHADEVEKKETAEVVSESKVDDATDINPNGQRNADALLRTEITKAALADFKFSLNPDVFSGQTPQTDEEREQMVKDEAQVRAVCETLTSDIIPKFIEQLQDGNEVGFPLDGKSLTAVLHKCGINMRYLGTIAKLANQEHPRLQALRSLVTREMVSRGFKHVANVYLRNLPPPTAPACMAHLLNCLLGTEFNPSPVPVTDEALKALYGEESFSFEGVSPESLGSEILEQIRLRFRYSVDGDLVVPGGELQMLREICLKCGVQILAREYNFTKDAGLADGAGETLAAGNGSSSITGKKKKKGKENTSPQRPESGTTFQPDDILNFVPLVKEASPKSSLAEEAFEGGRASTAKGLEALGKELLFESLSLYEQIHGVLHPEVARVYLALSSIYYSTGDKLAAAELARKAVIISERTLGVDASETVLAYLNLGLFEHACEKTVLGLKYVLHAMDLTNLIYGPNHPDSITTINNAAVMLQYLKRYHESRVWFEASLEMSEKVSGKGTVNSATLLFQLAQALALDRDSHAGVNRMRESFTLFRNLLGPDDRNTKEAEQWLDQLTQSAVNQAKRQKDIQTGKLRRIQLPIQTKPHPSIGQMASDVGTAIAEGNGADTRSIDELMKYINGDDVKKSPARKKGTNPKRRGGASMGQVVKV